MQTQVILGALVATVAGVSGVLTNAMNSTKPPSWWTGTTAVRLAFAGTLGTLTAVLTASVNGVSTWGQFFTAAGLGLLSQLPALGIEWTKALATT